MNILTISADRGIPIRGHKGAAVHVRTMTNAFARAGHTVAIVTPRPGPPDGPAPQAEIIHIPLPPKPAAPDEMIARDRQSQAHNELLFRELRRLTARQSFDFIYERYSLWSDAGARLAQATGLPLVLEVNAPLRDEAARFRQLSNPDLAARIERTQLAAATAVSVVSEQLKEYVVAHGAKEDRVLVLPNGVEPAHFHPAVRGGHVRNRYKLHEAIIVGFVGRPRPWHDIPTLLKAMAILCQQNPRYHLLLVGQVPDELPAQIAEHGLLDGVTLTGPVAHEDVPEHIAAMDVAVSSHAPLSDFYFSPLKLFEYLACGVPSVAADIGQPAQIISDGETGSLYPPGDAAALADRIETLLAYPALARQVAWQGAVMVLKKYTWDGNARAVLGWINPELGERPYPNRHVVSEPLLDRKLRQRLYRATRFDLARDFLAYHLPQFGKKGREKLHEVERIDILKYKEGRRCVLGYDLRGEGKKDGRATHHRVIGKVFRDERGRRLDGLQQWLWANGFAANSPDQISVPEPLGYIPKMRMQVQGFAPGQTLNELVQQRQITPLAIRAAEGLAKLHDTPLPLVALNGNGHQGPGVKPYTLTHELANLERFTNKLAQVKPEAMAAIRPLHMGLLDWAAWLPPLRQTALIHRDFYYSQVLVDGRHLTLIDFDLLAEGDPALDVANFAAHLHFLGLEFFDDFDNLAGDAEVFVDAYGRLRQTDDNFWRRFAFYRAATWFRLLSVIAPRNSLKHLFPDLLVKTEKAIREQITINN